LGILLLPGFSELKRCLPDYSARDRRQPSVVWLVAMAMRQAWINRELGLITVSHWRLYRILAVCWFDQSYDWKSGGFSDRVWIIVFFAPRGNFHGLGWINFLEDLPAQVIALDEYSYSTKWLPGDYLERINQVNPLFGLGQPIIIITRHFSDYGIQHSMNLIIITWILSLRWNPGLVALCVRG
jgi:hypothetical protein